MFILDQKGLNTYQIFMLILKHQSNVFFFFHYSTSENLSSSCSHK